jgi:hypothetical protein
MQITTTRTKKNHQQNKDDGERMEKKKEKKTKRKNPYLNPYAEFSWTRRSSIRHDMRELGSA